MSMTRGNLMAVFLGLVWIGLGTVQAEDRPRLTHPRVASAMQEWRQGGQETRLQALRSLSQMGNRATPAVGELLSGLSDPTPEIRAATADALGEIGSGAANSALIAALHDPALAVRSAAASALSHTRPDWRQAIPALAAGLRADPQGFGAPAVETLATMGRPVVPLAIELLREAKPELSSVGAQLLGRLGPAATAAIPSLIETLHRPERQIRELAAAALAAVAEPAIEALTRALSDHDPGVRGGAARALALMGEEARPAIEALIVALAKAKPFDDPRPMESENSEDDFGSPLRRPSGYQAALVAIGRASVPALLRQLENSDRPAQVRAVQTIGFLGERARAAVPRLIGLLSHADLRADAASALGMIGPPAQAAVPMLISALKNRDVALRLSAAEALGRIGEHVNEQRTPLIKRGVVAALVSALKDPDRRVRTTAAIACARIGSQASAAAPELVALLGEPEAQVRLAALRALGRIVQHSGPAQSALLGCLRDDNRRVRVAAAKAIAGSDLDSDAVIAGLLASLKDPDVEVRAAAAGRLVCTNGKGGFSLTERTLDLAEADSTTLARSPGASASVRAALADSDRRVRAAAAHILPIFKDKNDVAVAVPLLIERLNDPAVVVRVAAAKSLGQLDQAARPALPTLLQALTDPGELGVIGLSVSSKAAQALLAINPGDDKDVCDRLIRALGDPRVNVRDTVTATLGIIKDSLSSRLYHAIADPATGPPVQRRIVEILATEGMGGGMGGSSRPGGADDEALRPQTRVAVPSLCRLAEDADENVCLGAIRLLADIDPKTHPLPQSILDAVGKARLSLAQVAFLMQGAGPSEAPVLLRGLKDPNPDVRTVAAYSLAELAFDQQQKFQPDPDEARPEPTKAQVEERNSEEALKNRIVDALIPLLEDTDTQVRWAAAWALGSQADGEENLRSKAVPALLRIHKDRSTRIREGAWIRLANGALENGLNGYTDQNASTEKFRIAAIQVIGAFGEAAASAVPDLIDALKDDDPDVRWFAAKAIGSIGPPAKQAVPALIELFQASTRMTRDVDSVFSTDGPQSPATLRFMAAKALGKIGPEARAAVPCLLKAMNDRYMMTRIAAAEALGEIGPADPAVLPALERAMADTVDVTVAEQAAAAFVAIGEASVPVLIRALHDRDPDVRGRSARALSQMGVAAKAALPELERAAADDDPDARQVIEFAIQQIKQGAEAKPDSDG